MSLKSNKIKNIYKISIIIWFMDRRDFLEFSSKLTGIILTDLLIPNEIFANENDYYEKISLIEPNRKWYNQFISDSEKKVIDSVLYKLEKSRDYLGYKRFNYANFDDIFRARHFNRTEKKYLEDLFEFDAKYYGWEGDKQLLEINNKMSKKNLLNIKTNVRGHTRDTGHYLFKDITPIYDDLIRKIKAEDRTTHPILTSGVRNVPKQAYLFLNKTRRVKYNKKLASFSLAPPGYSYHGVGDLDIGKYGYSWKNFTKSFVKTKEFAALEKTGFKIRYDQNNQLGVRFEPWHIRIV